MVDGTAPTPQPVQPWEPQFVAPGPALEGPLAVTPPIPEPQQPVQPERRVLEAPADPMAGQQVLAPPPPPMEQMGPPAELRYDDAYPAYSRNGPQRDPETQAIIDLYDARARRDAVGAKGQAEEVAKYQQTLKANELAAANEMESAKAAEAKVGEAWDEVRRTKIDPNRMWNGMSGAQKAVSVIGAMIGGFLSARQQSGRNQFMDAFNQHVQQDIAAQESDLANMRASASGQQSLYAQMLQRFGNAQAARQMTAATMYQAGMDKVAADMAQYKSPETLAEGQLALAQLDQARRGALSSAQQQTFENDLKVRQQYSKEQNDRAQIALGYSNLAETRRNNAEQNKLRAAELEEKKAAAGPKPVPIYGADGPAAGPVGYARDSKKAGETDDMIAANAELAALYKRGKELLKDDYAAAGTDRRLQIEQWNAAWKNARFRATGRSDAPGDKELNQWGIDPSRVWGDNEVALDESFNTARLSAAPKLKAAGVTDTHIKSMGLVDPPTAENHTRKLETSGFYDETTPDHKGIGYNTEGIGRNATPEEDERYRKMKSGSGPVDPGWEYKRQQNLIHASQKRPGPLPFPAVGLGK